MTCDYCGCRLTPYNTYGNAPKGLPLFVCKSCAEKLKDSKIVEESTDEKERACVL